MTQNTTPRKLPSDDKVTQKQNEAQYDLPSLPKSTPDSNKAVQGGTKPHYPDWPTSKRGPMTTPPPPGTKPINAMRSEQVAEVGYNQETGEPSTQSPLRSLPDETLTGPTSFDQAETAQDVLKKRKERL